MRAQGMTHGRETGTAFKFHDELTDNRKKEKQPSKFFSIMAEKEAVNFKKCIG